MQFSMQAECPTLDVGTFVSKLKGFLREEMRAAIRDALEAMLARIPIRTGFLSGSFVKAAVKYGLPHNPIGNVPGPEYYRIGSIKILKTETNGQQFVEDQFTENGLIFEFNLQSAIIYWRINDLSARGSGTPWLSTDAAQSAFINRLSTLLTRVPDARTFIGKTSISVSKSGNVSVSKIKPG